MKVERQLEREKNVESNGSQVGVVDSFVYKLMRSVSPRPIPTVLLAISPKVVVVSQSMDDSESGILLI